MRAINGYQNKSLAVETLAQPANDEWMQEAIDGCAERDPTLPDRACGYCRYCWALAAEIAGLADSLEVLQAAGHGNHARSCLKTTELRFMAFVTHTNSGIIIVTEIHCQFLAQK